MDITEVGVWVWWREGVVTFAKAPIFRPKNCPVQDVNFPLLEWAHDWGPRWIVHHSCLLLPTNSSLSAPMSEGKGLNHKVKGR